MNVVRTAISKVSSALPVLLGAVVVSIVLGIVGMHALNTHGVTGTTDHTTMTGQVTGPMTGSHDDTPGDNASGPAGVTGTRDGTPEQGGDSGHGMGAMVMLCVAILAAAAGALLLLVAMRRVPSMWARLPAAPPTLRRCLTARLGTGPPPVWEFSVIRC